MDITYEMVADHIVLVVALSTGSLGDNPSPIHVVVVHNTEVNLVNVTLTS